MGDLHLEDGPIVDLFGRKFQFAYGGLSSARFQNIETFLSGTSYLYFIDTLRLPHGFFVFSPMAAEAYVITTEPPYILLPLYIGLEVWRVGQRLVSPVGFLDLARIDREVAKAVACLDNRRRLRRLLNGRDLYECFDYFKSAIRINPTLSSQYAPSRLRDVFRSEPGKRILAEFDRCWKSGCANDKLFSKVEDYIEQFQKDRIKDIDELFAVLMISGYQGKGKGVL